MRKGTILNPELGTCHLHIARSMKQGSMRTKSQTGHRFFLVDSLSAAIIRISGFITSVAIAEFSILLNVWLNFLVEFLNFLSKVAYLENCKNIL